MPKYGVLVFTETEKIQKIKKNFFRIEKHSTREKSYVKHLGVVIVSRGSSDVKSSFRSLSP